MIKKVILTFKLIATIVLLYTAYTAYIDVKQFIQNPLNAMAKAIPFRKEQKINTELLEQKLLKHTEYIFASNHMKLTYQFHQLTGLAKVDAKYEWQTTTKFGIHKDCIDIKHQNNTLNITISKIIIFKTIYDNIKRTLYNESLFWNDQGTSERAFRQDIPFASRDLFTQNFSIQKQKLVVKYAQESLTDFIKLLLEDKKTSIKINIEPFFEFENELKGSPSEFYKLQKKSALTDFTQKTK